ncbi:MAG: hypothetical protein QG567_1229 [Campylobacterota bacterium]|nr:hypothetical protein [Campylobacterota bacterium]
MEKIVGIILVIIAIITLALSFFDATKVFVG